MKAAPLRVYFDGACPLCSREMRLYRDMDPGEHVYFVDIAASEFDAAAEGLDPLQVNRVLHVRLPDGALATGVDAFVALWEALPRTRWMARVARWPMARPLLSVAYHVFARVRPYLPRRGPRACPGGSCEVHQ